MLRQRLTRASEVQVEWVRGRADCARGIDQRGGLTDDAARDDQDARYQPRNGGRDDRANGGLPAGRTQRQTCLAQITWYGAQSIFRGAQHPGQVEQSERQRTRNAREAKAKAVQREAADMYDGDIFAENNGSEEADDQRWHTRQCLGREAQDAQEALVARVLDEVDRRANTDRDHQEQREEQQIERIEDLGRDADIIITAFEEIKRDAWQPSQDSIEHDEGEDKGDEPRHRPEGAGGDAIPHTRTRTTGGRATRRGSSGPNADNWGGTHLFIDLPRRDSPADENEHAGDDDQEEGQRPDGIENR